MINTKNSLIYYIKQSKLSKTHMDEISLKLFDMPDEEIEKLWDQIHPKIENTKECIKAIAENMGIKEISFQTETSNVPDQYFFPLDTDTSIGSNASQSDVSDSDRIAGELNDMIQSYNKYFDKMTELRTKQKKLLRDFSDKIKSQD